MKLYLTLSFILMYTGIIGNHQASSFRSLRNCDKTTNGQKQCLRLPGYNGNQWTRCSDDKYMNLASGGLHRCAFNSNDTKFAYCWYPCQREYHLKDKGLVNGNCSCGEEPYVPPVVSKRPNDRAIKNTQRTRNYPVNKNCSYKNDGEKECSLEYDYARAQWIRCSSSTYILQKSGGKFKCDNNDWYCWFACQQDEFGLTEGEVNNECYCNIENLSDSSSKAEHNTPAHLMAFSLVILLIISVWL